MAERAKLTRDGAWARIVMAGRQEAPRGAGFDPALRADLQRAFTEALAGTSLRAIVLRAGEGGWPVAADPAQDYLAQADAPTLAGLAAMIARSPVPVIALMDGLVAGGALALAQAADLRIARPGTRFAAPEFGLGFVPGGGGMVRLARRIGVEPALEFVTSGQVLRTEAAHRLGLCDTVATGITADLPDDIAPRAAAIAEPQAYIDSLARLRSQPRQGPQAEVMARLLDVCEAAVLLPEEEAITFEGVACADLIAGEMSQALRHVLAARRRAVRLAGTGPGATAQITRLALWNPSERLTHALVERGVSVEIGASEPARLEQILQVVARAQHAAVAAGHLTEQQRAAAWDRLTPVAGIADFSPAQMVLAAPRPGEVAALRTHFAAGEGVLALEGVRQREAGELQFSRAAALAEVTGGPETDAALQALAGILRAERDLVIHAEGLSASFETTFWLAAERMVMAGATPAAVDAALTAWGFAEGPFARLDRRGLPAAFAQFNARDGRAGAYLNWLGLEGRTGRAAGKGVWLYGEAGARIWPEEEEELRALRREAGITPQALAPQEIVARILAELARAGADALQQGRAHRAGDVDLVAISVLGFPRHRGGPLFQADRAGLLAVRKRLRALADESAPAPDTLWDVLIRNGRRFAELDEPVAA
ncbi:enoyl-CoA hydratase/isomerase family protein [Paenirhodobacter populi]|uniref:Enoyl-CoA hydratase/isomerase family protein n=1 Tax=Paenirhodobacter populi TaxID=2306993 RepID=A0A443J2K2_9RHOB|nr:enoyl-CoA hydratase/isomerase family protein [Sinirhodobacter populi]RWR14704.1 enoyl-CoA hydratase/isomerase family protein [Sinirhodobacter populi]